VAADPLDPVLSAGKPSRFPVGLVLAALVESAWLLFLGWMAVGGA
jgi:hypothetical protein